MFAAVVGDDMIEAFVVGLGERPVDLGSAGSGAIERALEDAQRTAVGAWPGWPVPTAAFIEWLGRCVRGEGPDYAAALGKVLAADVYHCCACMQRLPAALEVLERTHLAELPAFISHLDRSADFADEVGQTVRQKLLVGEGDAPGRLTHYLGHGPLRSWIAVVSQRTALDMLRRQKRAPAFNDSALERYLSTSADPDLMLAKGRLRSQFEEALKAALGRLSLRERTALRLTLLAGFSLEKVGAMYGVNASTVSRWLSRARQGLLDDLRTFLVERRNLDPAELESIVRLVRSQVDVSLSGILAGGDSLLPMS